MDLSSEDKLTIEYVPYINEALPTASEEEVSEEIACHRSDHLLCVTLQVYLRSSPLIDVDLRFAGLRNDKEISVLSIAKTAARSRVSAGR